MTITFEPASIPDDYPTDSIPETSDIEYPCDICGKEAGPYSGRGRKPKKCAEHRKVPSSGTKRVTGAPANLAAQATAVLVQVNGMMAIGLMATQFHRTAHALAEANSSFEPQAYQALLTDPDLCKLILKSGGASGKVSLALAYVGLAMTIAPAAMGEYAEKKAEREARKVAMDDESGG